jgi:hypothetical protein
MVADTYDPLNPNGVTLVSKSTVQGTRPPIIGKFEIIKGPNHSDKSNTSLVVEGIPPGPSPHNPSPNMIQ